MISAGKTYEPYYEWIKYGSDTWFLFKKQIVSDQFHQKTIVAFKLKK